MCSPAIPLEELVNCVPISGAAGGKPSPFVSAHNLSAVPTLLLYHATAFGFLFAGGKMRPRARSLAACSLKQHANCQASSLVWRPQRCAGHSLAWLPFQAGHKWDWHRAQLLERAVWYIVPSCGQGGSRKAGEAGKCVRCVPRPRRMLDPCD